MPICRTCRGEYVQQGALCHVCGTPVGRCVDLCSQCGADTSEKRLCPRCRSDVSAWEREDSTLLGFIVMKGGFLGLIPAFVALMAQLLFWSVREHSLYYYPVLMLSSLTLSSLTFYILYTKRLFWWERWWASQVYRATPVPVVSAMLISGLGGVFLTALSLFLYAVWHKPAEPWQKGIFAIVYVLAYVCFTILLTLLPLHHYLSRLERQIPQPIFVDTNRLLMVVRDTVIENINLIFRFDRQNASVLNHQLVYEAMSTQRIPENGGILVTFRECKPVRHPDETGQMQEEWIERLWRVQADRWGRVQLVKPLSAEPNQNERVFRDIYGPYS